MSLARECASIVGDVEGQESPQIVHVQDRLAVYVRCPEGKARNQEIVMILRILARSPVRSRRWSQRYLIHLLHIISVNISAVDGREELLELADVLFRRDFVVSADEEEEVHHDFSKEVLDHQPPIPDLRLRAIPTSLG